MQHYAELPVCVLTAGLTASGIALCGDSLCFPVQATCLTWALMLKAGVSRYHSSANNIHSIAGETKRGLTIGKVLPVTLSGGDLFLEAGKADWVLGGRACHMLAHTLVGSDVCGFTTMIIKRADTHLLNVNLLMWYVLLVAYLLLIYPCAQPYISVSGLCHCWHKPRTYTPTHSNVRESSKQELFTSTETALKENLCHLGLQYWYS